MRNWEQTFRRIMRCSSQAFGSASTWVAFDAFGDLLFFNSKKKLASGVQLPQQFKNAALMRREAGTAQIALRVARHALACKVGYIVAVGCEMALRAVRDGIIGGSFGMVLLQWLL